MKYTQAKALIRKPKIKRNSFSLIRSPKRQIIKVSKAVVKEKTERLAPI